MKYRVRSGVVYRTICGDHLLIATLDAQEYCPYSTAINEDTAFVWELVAAGASDDEVLSAVAEEYGQTEENVRDAVNGLIKQLVRQGFLIEENDT